MVSLRRAYCVIADSRSEALKAQALAKPAPCDFADNRIWQVYQAKDDAILCLRPADKRGLPIALMHKTFCDFTHHFRQPSLDEHIATYLPMADKLCQTMPSAFDSEVARQDAFESIFSLLHTGLVLLEYQCSHHNRYGLGFPTVTGYWSDAGLQTISVHSDTCFMCGPAIGTILV